MQSLVVLMNLNVIIIVQFNVIPHEALHDESALCKFAC